MKRLATALLVLAIPAAAQINPSLIRARVTVTDIFRPTVGELGPGDPARVRVMVTFGGGARLDSVYCTGDTTAPVELAFADARWEGVMPRGRAFSDGRPNYYMIHARAGGRDYAVARVPVVDPLSIETPRPGEPLFNDQNVRVSLFSSSLRVLWSDTDPHFQFQHDNTAVVTERLADGSERQIGRASGAGTREDPNVIMVTPAAVPPATPGNAGVVHALTRYRSDHNTIGPSDFLLDEWVSIAGAPEREFLWITCCTTAGADHIMLGAASLDEGMREFERLTGVRPVRGGRHPSRGTENALVSLGRGVYLEIIAPQPDAKPNEMVNALRAMKRPALVGWAVHVPDAKDAAARMAQAGFKATASTPGSRVTPEGKTLEWVTFVAEQPEGAVVPFFIRWGAATAHPSTTSPGGCAIASFAVADPAGAELSKLLGALGVTADVKTAKDAQMRLALRCGAREATFTSP